MILTKTYKNVTKNSKFKNFNCTLQSLIQIKKKKTSKRINSYKNLNCNNREFNQNPVNYILTLNVLPTNSLINLAKPNGDILISLSGGYINLKKRQKKLQPLALINLLKSLCLMVNFKPTESIAIHFKNVKPFYTTVIIKMLKRVFFIRSTKSFHLQPHNGCRPKKLRKFKKRTKRN